MITVTDGSGKIIKQFKGLARGNGSIMLQAGSLASGTYNYTLIVDGKNIATKQMVLTR
jgi:hypothetical protein